MKKYKLYNSAHPLGESGKSIFLPFGEWPYDETVRQAFTKENGIAIANELNAGVERGEPGIPVYQGHPDVPHLAAKYPDKGALGWVVKMELANENGKEGLALTVDWDRDPGKGFKWFSPYWFGSRDSRGVVAVDTISSIGLVNTPNINEFRLPNESAEDNEKGQNIMDIEELKKLLGLPAEATEDDVKAAISANAKANEELAAEKAKAEAAGKEAEDKIAAANAEAEDAKKSLDEAKAETEQVKTELANERAAHEKLKALKTTSVTTGLANEKTDAKDGSQRLKLVNELRAKENIDFDTAWCRAKKEKPELFK